MISEASQSVSVPEPFLSAWIDLCEYLDRPGVYGSTVIDASPRASCFLPAIPAETG